MVKPEARGEVAGRFGCRDAADVKAGLRAFGQRPDESFGCPPGAEPDGHPMGDEIYRLVGVGHCVFAPTGRPTIARGGSPWTRAVKSNCLPPQRGGAPSAAPLGRKTPGNNCAHVQGLPPLAIVGRPVEAKTSHFPSCFFAASYTASTVKPNSLSRSLI